MLVGSVWSANAQFTHYCSYKFYLLKLRTVSAWADVFWRIYKNQSKHKYLLMFLKSLIYRFSEDFKNS